MRRRFLLLFLAVVPFLVGCSGAPNWLRGDWVLDTERSQHAQTDASAAQPGNLADGMAKMLQGFAIPLLQTMQLTITGTDIITTIQGQGKAFTYKIVRRSGTECTVQKSDGTVETYYRDGDDIYIFGTGGLSSMKVYFKRKT